MVGSTANEAITFVRAARKYFCCAGVRAGLMSNRSECGSGGEAEAAGAEALAVAGSLLVAAAAADDDAAVATEGSRDDESGGRSRRGDCCVRLGDADRELGSWLLAAADGVV